MSAAALQERYQAYETALSALEAVRLLLKSDVQKRLGLAPEQVSELLAKAKLEGLSVQEIRERLASARADLEALVALSLFAAFEKILREHLRQALSPLQTLPLAPAELPAAFHNFLLSECLWWKAEDLIELFSPPVDTQTRGKAKEVKSYRDFVAHQMRAAGAVEPPQAFAHLSEYLRQAGLAAAKAP